MTIATVRCVVLLFVAMISSAQSNNLANIQTSLTALDTQLKQNNFIDASRTSGEVLGQIFAAIQAHLPKSFEPSGVKMPAVTVADLLSITSAIRQALQKPDLILTQDLAMKFSVQKPMRAAVVPPSVPLAHLSQAWR